MAFGILFWAVWGFIKPIFFENFRKNLAWNPTHSQALFGSNFGQILLFIAQSSRFSAQNLCVFKISTLSAPKLDFIRPPSAAEVWNRPPPPWGEPSPNISVWYMTWKKWVPPISKAVPVILREGGRGPWVFYEKCSMPKWLSFIIQTLPLTYLSIRR